ncbi:hypothetical protein Pmani_027519 [Petrolisthes manimaculis]|uniref:Ammonium transporter AmtB-like domain-containing protein n=2 Tax=Petrolisthes manimaculis TaxID=1843537 RepID=A0AAE1TZ05_9EUCA|nr:hypothetical protein Pmani_027519 [Petrolisthes manimaculis]
MYLTPFLCARLRIHDTCGVHNLHGIPGVLAGIIGCVCAAMATEHTYGPSLYKIFPARAPPEGPKLDALRELFGSEGLEAGQGITAGTQASYQILALLVTMGISVAGGLVTGLVLRLPIFNLLKTDELYEDAKYWLMEEGEDEEGRDGSVSLPMADNGASK